MNRARKGLQAWMMRHSSVFSGWRYGLIEGTLRTPFDTTASSCFRTEKASR
ncbi:hypothetical protein SAMN03159406_01474 [Rhizobium sp. NFR03]|nr:hypothetical protein SAMN03159406_01474 [Rhizobium sp. NFR03]